VERQAAGEGSLDWGDLYACAQCPDQVGPAYGAAPEGSAAAAARKLYAEAGAGGIGGERGSLCGDACGGARRWGPCGEVCQRRLGSAVAGWRGNAVLHDFSRGAPSRAGVDAGASDGIPVAERGDVWPLELGKDLERVRGDGWPWRRWLRKTGVHSVLFGGEGLLGKFGAEFLLFFSHEFFVAIGIEEGVRSAGFQVRIFCFQAEVAAVGAQENIAGQGL
jgi:hypothetical protein